jgi:hypothetical protein
LAAAAQAQSMVSSRAAPVPGRHEETTMNTSHLQAAHADARVAELRRVAAGHRAAATADERRSRPARRFALQWRRRPVATAVETS